MERYLCRIGRGYGQSYGTIARVEYSSDVAAMARHLGALQREEAELLGDVIAHKLTTNLCRAALEFLEMFGLIKRDGDEFRPEHYATDEDREREALRRANALARSLRKTRR